MNIKPPRMHATSFSWDNWCNYDNVRFRMILFRYDSRLWRCHLGGDLCQLVGAYVLGLFEGPTSKSCKAPLRMIHVAIPLLWMRSYLGSLATVAALRFYSGLKNCIVSCWYTLDGWARGLAVWQLLYDFLGFRTKLSNKGVFALVTKGHDHCYPNYLVG